MERRGGGDNEREGRERGRERDRERQRERERERERERQRERERERETHQKYMYYVHVLLETYIEASKEHQKYIKENIKSSQLIKQYYITTPFIDCHRTNRSESIVMRHQQKHMLQYM